MKTDELRTELARLADAVPAAHADPVAAVTGRARRTRRRRLTATAVVVAMAVASIGVWASRDAGTGHRVVADSGSPSTTTAAPAGSAAALAGFSWSALPAPPIVDRSGASVVWTGTELVVWGGVIESPQGETPKVDGAAYDPASNQWHPIAVPGGGLSARSGAITLWTGTEVLVIGGLGPNGAGLPANDGAYDPATNGWRVLAKRPAVVTEATTGLWTGTRAVIVSSTGSVVSYDPKANRWTGLPSVPDPGGREPTSVVPVWAGDRLLAWVEWSQETTTGNIVTGSFGIDLWSLDGAFNRWTERPRSAAGPGGIDTPTWTGTEVLLPAADTYRGAAGAGGVIVNRHGFTYDPSSNAYTSIAHGPVDDGSVGALWTGRALVRIAHSEIGGAEAISPGDAAAFDPGTDAWVTLPKSPIATYDAQLVWAGHEILSYGPGSNVRFGPPGQS